MTLITILPFSSAVGSSDANLYPQKSERLGNSNWGSEIIDFSDATELELLREIFLTEAKRAGVNAYDLEISQDIEPGEYGLMAASCTASVSVNVPGIGSVEVSATAETCTQAVSMLLDMIDNLPRIALP